MKNKLEVALRIWLCIGVVTLLFLGALPSPSQATDVDFKGKVIDCFVAGNPGGASDILGRELANFWPRYLPGKPRIIVRPSARGGELIGFNSLYEKARKDGTSIGLTSTEILAGELLNLKIRRYQLTKMPIIATFPDGLAIIYNKKLTTGWKDMIAMGDKLVIGGSVQESPSSWSFMFFKKFLNPKMKVIFGYDKGVARTALLRGELTAGKEASPEAVAVFGKDPDVGVAFTIGIIDSSGNVVRDPLFPDAPTILEIYQEVKGTPLPPLELRVYKLIVAATTTFARSYWLPPDTPANIVSTMQKAMAEVVRDPGFRKIAAVRLAGYEPVIGEKAENLVKSTLGQSSEALDWLRNWLSTEYDVR